MRPALAAMFIVLAAMAARPALAGETRCWLDNGMLTAPAAFGDIAGEFAVDPASPECLLHVDNAAGFGLTGAAARSTLTFAGERRPGFNMGIADLDARSRASAVGLAGVIGADALAGRVLEIRRRPCRLTLGRRPPRARAGDTRLPLRRIAGVWAARASVSDGTTARSGWFALDFSRWTSPMAGARLSRQPAPAADPPVRLRALALGGRLFEQVPSGIMADPPTGIAGAIGESVWSRYDLTLDARHGWLILRPLP